MHFSHTDIFVLGLLLGIIIAVVLSWLVHVVAFWLVVGAIVFGAFLIGRRWLERKFRIGL